MFSPSVDLHWVLFLVLAAPGPAQGGGWLGVAFHPDRDEPTIVEVVPDSPAEQAGLAPGDRIVAIDGTTVATVEDLVRALSRREVRAEVRLGVRRRGRHLESVLVRLGRRPSVAAEVKRPVRSFLLPPLVPNTRTR